MFPGRIGALRGARLKEGKSDRTGFNKFGNRQTWLKRSTLRKRELESELKALKTKNLGEFEDFDLYENTKTLLRFRKYPWGHWFLGLSFWGGAIFVIFMCYENLMHFKKRSVEYALLAFLIICGFAFLWAGRTKSTIFDRATDSLVIRKRNIFCHRRVITKYKLSDLADVRAVWRGINRG